MSFDMSLYQWKKIMSVKADNTKGITKPRVLLVVSNDFLRDIFKELFERSGYNTVAVDKAIDGFKALNDECFDIVICDFDLYDSTGVEFFESTKDICPDRINILMITPGDLMNVPGVEKLNIRHIIEKPFTFEDLLIILKNS
jgi:two-component system response regulator HydG